MLPTDSCFFGFSQRKKTPKYIHASFSIIYMVTETFVHGGGGGVCMNRMGPAQPQVQSSWGGGERQQCLPESAPSGPASPQFLL